MNVAQSGQIWVAWVVYYVIYEQFIVMAILKKQGFQGNILLNNGDF